MERIEDPNLAVNTFFNSDGTRKGSSIEDLSINKAPVRNVRRKKSKPKGIKDIAKKIMILTALGASLTMGINTLNEEMDINENKKEIKDSLEEVVVNNTEYGGYNESEQRPYWWYNYSGIAQGILDNNEYDIDTRIYCAFDKLKEYKKIESMDKIFSKMSQIIASDPSKYDVQTIASSVHPSFCDYLESKGLSLEEYSDLMNKILRCYAEDGRNNDSLSNLLNELNSGRNGGSR